MSDAVMTDRPVSVQRDGPVTTLVLSRPERRNPLSLETMTDLTARLREVGKAARQQIEALLGTPVYLDLHVKIAKDWQRDPRQLRKLGF